MYVHGSYTLNTTYIICVLSILAVLVHTGLCINIPYQISPIHLRLYCIALFQSSLNGVFELFCIFFAFVFLIHMYIFTKLFDFVTYSP